MSSPVTSAASAAALVVLAQQIALRDRQVAGLDARITGLEALLATASPRQKLVIERDVVMLEIQKRNLGALRQLLQNEVQQFRRLAPGTP